MFFSRLLPNGISIHVPRWSDQFTACRSNTDSVAADGVSNARSADSVAVEELLFDLRPEWQKLFQKCHDREPLKHEQVAFEQGVLERFFDWRAQNTDERTYIPIPLREWPEPDRERSRKPLARYDDLVDALLDESTEPQKLGLLLRARTGSGKTLAARVAFLEAFCLSQRLKGWLPCWLSDDKDLPEIDTHGLIAHLVARVSGVPVPMATQALRSGPRMVLCLDLNGVSSNHRERMAKALVDFQERQADRPAHLRHRCVVAYRSTQETDQVTALLSDTFRAFDLQPLAPQQAIAYVSNIREFLRKERIRVRRFGQRRGIPAGRARGLGG